MTKFTSKEIDYGKCELIGNMVWVYESLYQRRALQAPCGNIAEAHWLNGKVHVIMASGDHYAYNGTSEYQRL